MTMKMSCPKFTTWLLATALGVGGILMRVNVLHLGRLTPYAFWFVVAGFGLLCLGTLTRSL
jgi:hypothetical protein